MKEHSCFKKVNDNLAEKTPSSSLTMKIDSKIRGKAVLLLTTFCPFCGKKLEVE